MFSGYDYLFDALQRSILFWDVLRQRGDNYLEHQKRGQPAVLQFRLRDGHRRAEAGAPGQLCAVADQAQAGMRRPIRRSGRT